MRDPATDLAEYQGNFERSAVRILETVEANSLTLQDLLQQVAEVRDVVAAHLHPASSSESDRSDPQSDQQCLELRRRILELEDQVYDLEQQNSDLASQVASRTVKQTVQTDAAETLSWEERKQLILQQMEQDAFCADQFVQSLRQEHQDLATENPASLLDELRVEMDRHAEELARRDDEIRELRHLLQEQGATRNQGGVAIGAAAIAQALDADELVRDERERLQQMQKEWEEKFRQGEIQMSLERAQLSRERQELAKKQSELELQLEQMKRDAKYASADGSPPARKWLAKLGLSEE